MKFLMIGLTALTTIVAQASTASKEERLAKAEAAASVFAGSEMHCTLQGTGSFNFSNFVTESYDCGVTNKSVVTFVKVKLKIAESKKGDLVIEIKAKSADAKMPF